MLIKKETNGLILTYKHDSNPEKRSKCQVTVLLFVGGESMLSQAHFFLPCFLLFQIRLLRMNAAGGENFFGEKNDFVAGSSQSSEAFAVQALISILVCEKKRKNT